MEPDIRISDVVVSTAGHDAGSLYYCVASEGNRVMLVNGRDHPLEKPKRKNTKHVSKVLRAETRVALKLASGDKVLNSELRRDLAFFSRELASHNQGG